MDPQLKKNLSSSHSWFRVIYVVLFIFAAEVAATIALIIAFVQVIFSLITGQANERLIRFGDSLAKYLYACYLFVVYKSEDKPFPFADWPEGEGSRGVVEGEVIEANPEVAAEQAPEPAVETIEEDVAESAESPQASELKDSEVDDASDESKDPKSKPE